MFADNILTSKATEFLFKDSKVGGANMTFGGTFDEFFLAFIDIPNHNVN